MKTEIRLAGFGGQGIALAGYILGKAASLHANLHAVMTQNYGPESRGGASLADVVISDREIGYPAVTRPDILVVMSQEAYRTYGRDLAPTAILLADSDLVQVEPDRVGDLHRVPFARTAEEIGKKIVANIVMLGGLVAITNIISREAVLEAVLSTVPARFRDLNAKAYEKGCLVGSASVAGK